MEKILCGHRVMSSCELSYLCLIWGGNEMVGVTDSKGNSKIIKTYVVITTTFLPMTLDGASVALNIFHSF